MASKLAFVAMLALANGLAVEVADVKSQLEKRAEYSTDDYVAEIIWYENSDCDTSGKVNSYLAPGLNESLGDPDQCDAGVLPYTDGDQLANIDYSPKSFKVIVPAFTRDDGSVSTAICEKKNGYQASVILYVDCRPQYNKAANNYACPPSCTSYGWSHNDGYGVCVNVGEGTVTASSIAQRVGNCSPGQAN